MRRFLFLTSTFCALALSACGSDSALPEATGKGSLRAINAIKTSPEIVFMIEEQGLDSIAYKQVSSTSRYDDLNYTFNFETLFFGDAARTRVANLNLDVVANKDYTFLLSGALAAPTITVWEGDVREWTEGEAVTEIRFAHSAASEDPIDVYITAPDIDPVDGEEVGTLAFGEVLPAIDRDAGAYEITITKADNIGAVLFQTDAIITEPTTSLLISLFDGDANDVADFALQSFNATSGGTASLADSRFNPSIRFFHASQDLGPVDIFTEDLLAMPAPTPLLGGHDFRDVTDDITVERGVLPITYTTANDTMVIHFQENLALAAGVRWDMTVIGPAGSPQVVASRVDRRSVETVARVSLLNTASNHEALDLFIVDRDVDISAEEVSPSVIGLGVTGSSIRLPLVAGSYDLYLTTSGEKTVVTGPFALDLVLGDNIKLIAYDVADTAFAEIVTIPLPAPAPPP